MTQSGALTSSSSVRPPPWQARSDADVGPGRGGRVTRPPAPRASELYLAAAYLAGLVAFGIYSLGPSLSRSWYFSSDEYVFAAEVIRFLHLDFRQRFFDIPGTPFMFLSAGLWALVYASQLAVGLVPPGTSLDQFTFH